MHSVTREFTKKPELKRTDIDIPLLMGLSTTFLSVALFAVGFFGALQICSMQSAAFPWAVVGLSAAITLTSAGILSPGTLTTLALGVLGLMGTIPLGSVGIGVLIVMPLTAIGAYIALKKC